MTPLKDLGCYEDWSTSPSCDVPSGTPPRPHGCRLENADMKIAARRLDSAHASRLWAYLTLLRPVNVVTALADVLAGAAATGQATGLPGCCCPPPPSTPAAWC